MINCAVICEYNPFHTGHAYQIRQLREMLPDACIVSVQSGNFVQRGEAAVLNKYLRARAAVLCGSDLVLELPFPWCASGAEFFARAGVSIVGALGCRALCFGSESGDLSSLRLAAERLCMPAFAEMLAMNERESMSSGISHIAAVRSTYSALYGEELPAGSNDTLAVEYLKAARTLCPGINPVCISRLPGYGATLAREYLLVGDSCALADGVPEELMPLYSAAKPVQTAALGSVILNFFGTHSAEELARFADLGGGLSGRLCRAARDAADYSSFISLAATKKYTNARIRRAVLSAMLGVTEEKLRATPLFTTLLAAGSRGTAFLREAKKRGGITVLTRPAEGKAMEGAAGDQFALSCAADTLWALAAGEPASTVMTRTPFILG